MHSARMTAFYDSQRMREHARSNGIEESIATEIEGPLGFDSIRFDSIVEWRRSPAKGICRSVSYRSGPRDRWTENARDEEDPCCVSQETNGARFFFFSISSIAERYGAILI